MSEDPFLTGLRVEDEKIIEEMDKIQGDQDKYLELVKERYQLYLNYETKVTNITTRYLISTMRQSISTELKLSILQEAIAQINSRLQTLETKS